MSRNWIRAVGLQVGTGGGSLDLSQMRIRFYLHPASTETPHGAEVRVYNLSDDTAEKLLVEGSGSGKNLTLSAGYVENSGVLYSGEIIRSQKGRESETDTFLDFWCQDGDRAYNHGVINKTFAAGSTQRDHVDEVLRVLKPLGIVEGVIKGLSQTPYPLSVSLYGMARNAMRTIAHSNDAAWYVKRGKLNHIPNKDPGKSGGAFVLNENTGLVGMPVETQSGIIVTALINPQYEVGKQLIIDQKKIQRAPWTVNYDADALAGGRVTGVNDGVYHIQGIEWRGDTHDTEWYATMTCYGVKTGTIGAGTQNLLAGKTGAS